MATDHRGRELHAGRRTVMDYANYVRNQQVEGFGRHVQKLIDEGNTSELSNIQNTFDSLKQGKKNLEANLHGISYTLDTQNMLDPYPGAPGPENTNLNVLPSDLRASMVKRIDTDPQTAHINL